MRLCCRVNWEDLFKATSIGICANKQYRNIYFNTDTQEVLLWILDKCHQKYDQCHTTPFLDLAQ